MLERPSFGNGSPPQAFFAVPSQRRGLLPLSLSVRGRESAKRGAGKDRDSHLPFPQNL